MKEPQFVGGNITDSKPKEDLLLDNSDHGSIMASTFIVPKDELINDLADGLTAIHVDNIEGVPVDDIIGCFYSFSKINSIIFQY